MTVTQSHTSKTEERLHDSNSVHVLLLNEPPRPANKSSTQREVSCAELTHPAQQLSGQRRPVFFADSYFKKKMF